MFARKYFALAMIIVLSLNLGGCFPAFVFLAAPAEAWYITMDYPSDPIVTRPFSFYKKGNTDEFAVEIKDMQAYDLVLLTEKEIFHEDILYGKPFRWKIEVSVWQDDELLERQTLGKAKTGSSFQGPTRRGRSFSYLEVVYLGELPSLQSSLFWSKTYTVKIEVKEIDERFTDPKLPALVGIKPHNKL